MLIARYFLPQVSPAPCTYGEIIHNNNSNRILEEEEKMTVGNGWRENKVNVLLATPEINRIEERERERWRYIQMLRLITRKWLQGTLRFRMCVTVVMFGEREQNEDVKKRDFLFGIPNFLPASSFRRHNDDNNMPKYSQTSRFLSLPHFSARALLSNE